jgi:GTP cyclohydrolase II
MNHLSTSLTAPAPASTLPHREDCPDSPSRYVRHAVLDARAGLPIAVHAENGSAPPLVILAAETATDAGLASFLAAAAGQPQLVLAPSRAATIAPGPAGGTEPVAFHLAPAQMVPATLLALADPTRPQAQTGLSPIPAKPLAGTALLLAKLGRLLPAMLIADTELCHGLTTVSAEDVLAFQAEAITSLVRVAEAAVPLAEAKDARLVAFRPADGGLEHVALLIGHPEHAEAPLVRIHSECFTGDLLGSLRCDCGPQLHQAIQRMEAEGSGVLLYMAQEGRGIGLVNKLRAYALQDRGLDTLDANRALGWGADERSFAAAALMLRDLGVTKIRLLTNNPEKMASLQAAGIEVAGLRHAIAANGVNDGYLETKARRFGHLLG